MKNREVVEQRKEGKIRGGDEKEKKCHRREETKRDASAGVCAQDSYSPPSAALRLSAAIELRPGKETKTKRRGGESRRGWRQFA